MRNFSDRESGVNGEEPGIVHIVSWMECLDLRVLAVLANSTLSGSRFDQIYSDVKLMNDYSYG